MAKDARVGVTGEGLSGSAAVQGREAWPTSSSGQFRGNLGSNPSGGILGTKTPHKEVGVQFLPGVFEQQ